MDIYQQKNFNVFVNKSTLYWLNLKEGTIRRPKAKEVFKDIEYQKHKEHMKTLRTGIFSSPNKNENLSIRRFDNTIDSLQRLKPKKKLFCRYDEYYLVKKYFTEGVQYVNPGQIHTYKPLDMGKPLDIYISSKPLHLNTFRSDYDSSCEHIRISPGETKTIPSNTHYVVIAPCHTIFSKEIKNTPEVTNAIEKSTEADRQVMSVTKDRRGASDQSNGLCPQPSGSRDDEYGNSRGFSISERLGETEMVNGSASTGCKRFSIENDRQSKRAKYSTPGPGASTSGMGYSPVPTSTNSFKHERSSSELTDQLEELNRMYTFPQPSGSREDDIPKHSIKLEKPSETETVNGNTSTGTRSSTPIDRQLVLATSITPETKPSSHMEVASLVQSPNALRNEMDLMSNIGTSNGDHGRAVFAIRKDSNIESYALRSDSTFQILHDNIVTGSFAIENDDMDPCLIEYHGDVQFIREVAKFKNGSKFETTITVQRDLLNELRDATKKKEKVVVNYFFDLTFKTIEAAYKKFSEMRFTKMIGSCVPAIVPLSDARFFGDVSDAYEAKP